MLEFTKPAGVVNVMWDYNLNGNPGVMGFQVAAFNSPDTSLSNPPLTMLADGTATRNLNVTFSAPGVHYIAVRSFTSALQSDWSVPMKLTITAANPNPKPEAPTNVRIG